MKKNVIKLLFFFIVLVAATHSVSAQVYVHVRPQAPVVVRTEQPSHQHVWINEEWEPNGKEYRYSGGRWVAPPHPGNRWKAGYWKRHKRDGQLWVPGHWRG